MRSRSVQSMSRAAFSGSGTSNGFTSYDETQVDVVVHRLGGELDRVRWSSAAATWATATAASATRTASSGVSTTPEAKPHAPPWITRTAKPRSSVSLAPWSDAVADAEVLVADPLEAEVGVAWRRARGPGRARRRRGCGRGAR